MVEIVHQYVDEIRSQGLSYRARVYGQLEDNGHWGGYVVFVPVAGGRVVATDRETTQLSVEDLAHWAGTLSWVYLEGALERALERQPEVQLSKRLSDIEHAEEVARAEAKALELAAARAREDAAAARIEREKTERELARATADAADAAAAFHTEAADHARSIARTAKKRTGARGSGRKRR
jgi:hypothetical protein